MAKADHIKVRRYWLLYAHHGIDMGDGSVIHFTDRGKPVVAGDGFRPRIVQSPINEFLDGGELITVPHKSKTSLPTDETLRLAQEALEQPNKYNLVFNNCEHFANYCKTGSAKSSQVKRVVSMAIPLLVVAGGLLIRGRGGKLS